MSLVGVISNERLCVRAGVSTGRAWNCIVQNSADTCLAAFRGESGAVAVAPPSEGWVVLSSGTPTAGREQQSRGHIVIGATEPIGVQPFVRLSRPSIFAYSGTIEDAHALQVALDPTWAADTTLRTPGEVIFAHVFSYMAAIGALYARDVALSHASRAIWRARHLGSASFLYCDGNNLYAYSVGLPLVLVTLAGAIVVCSPDVVPEGSIARRIPDGAVVSASRRPHLGWSTAVVADE